jgi:restriction endonuclease Mrr
VVDPAPIRKATMLELSQLDLDEIATALEDQTGYEHCWQINPRSGDIVFWTEDGGIDGRSPLDLDELDLLPIEPLPSCVWYRDMADFADSVSDQRAGRGLNRAIQGKGAFRRFKDRLHDDCPRLVPAWHAFHAARAKQRAIEWLVDNSLVDDDTAARALVDHPDPELP